MNHHPAMFSGHWSSTSGDIKYLIREVTSQKHVIEGSSNFMSGSSLWYVNTLPNWVAINSRDIMFSIYHVIKQNHVIKGSGG